ncbi:MAG TPA: helix-turn-helix transcriptional regulator [Geminicoccus sp.]|uniref:helix-turn-helix domain-containing protein n=1 Tax=Geminicoccus sp. TaxID=2024832 RepID=UPI002E3768DA|nr:helix-turn-helix transcriptional regulator [Geminicoccus sp.]HEX2525244.1 helix-turn-helix transcriptional regulator [Geminicoccus sp.]
MRRDSFGTRLRALRTAKGWSQVELARLIHRHSTAIGPYERDEYAPPREVVDRIADLLDTTPEYLWFGRSPKRPGLTVSGRIGAGGCALSLESPIPPLAVRVDRMRAWQVEDDANAPMFRQGQLVLTAADPVEPAETVGRFAIVRLPDDRELLRRVLPGPKSGMFLVCLAGGEGTMVVEITDARPVLGVLEAAAASQESQADE